MHVHMPDASPQGQKVWHVPRNQGNQTFWAGHPGILLGYPGGARKFEKKNAFNFGPLEQGRSTLRAKFAATDEHVPSEPKLLHALLNDFQINFPKISLTLTLFNCFQINFPSVR